MLTRLVVGGAGVAVLVISIAIVLPQASRILGGAVANTLGALFVMAGIMGGVYLLFYSMTGEWLPKLTKRKG